MQVPWRICSIDSDTDETIAVFKQASQLYHLEFGTDRNAPDSLSTFRHLWDEHLGCSDCVQALFVARSSETKTEALNVWGFACAHPLMRDLDPTLHDLLSFQNGMQLDPRSTMIISPLVVAPAVYVHAVVKDLVSACKRYADNYNYDHILLWQPMVPSELVVVADLCGLETYVAGRLLDDDLVIPPSAIVYWGATS